MPDAPPYIPRSRSKLGSAVLLDPPSGRLLNSFSRSSNSCFIERKSTNCVMNWILSLSLIKRDFAIEWVLYRVGQNKYLFRDTADTFAGAGWSGSYHDSGWGSNTPGRIYKPGAYYINFFVDGDLIAKGEFEVY